MEYFFGTLGMYFFINFLIWMACLDSRESPSFLKMIVFALPAMLSENLMFYIWNDRWFRFMKFKVGDRVVRCRVQVNCIPHKFVHDYGVVTKVERFSNFPYTVEELRYFSPRDEYYPVSYIQEEEDLDRYEGHEDLKEHK